jgi:hypothetical protein
MTETDDLVTSLTALDGFAILERGINALEKNDLEAATYIADYLTTRKKKKFHGYLTSIMRTEFRLEPIPFLSLARQISRKYVPETRGTYKVYVILLDGYSKSGRYGLYVGQTSRKIDVRYEQHLEGGRLSAKCHKKMKRLLPSLYAHFPAMTKKESIEIEEALADDFRSMGIRTEGGRKSLKGE